jgi:hypothetical protein
MILASAPLAHHRSFSPRRSDRNEERWPRRSASHRLRRPRHDGLSQQADCSGIEETVEQLVQMNLCSLRGYQEIADTTNDPRVRDFADVMLRQRSAQFRELATGWTGLDVLADESDPAACEMGLHWARALWSIDQEEPRDGLEAIEEAEQLLEDAYLNAASLYPRCSITAVFNRHATNVCGARQRLEGGLVEDESERIAGR